MAALFPDEHRSITLTLVVGFGNFGNSVVEKTRELLELLPGEIARAALFVVLNDSNRLDLLTEERYQLAARETVEALRNAGWEVTGDQVGNYTVSHLLVGEIECADAIKRAVQHVRSNWPADLVQAIVTSPDACNALRQWPFANENLPVWLVSSPDSRGLNVDNATLVAATAGVIVVAIASHQNAPLLAGQPGVHSFGFAGYYGLAGASQRRLAEHLALRLARAQLAQKPLEQGTLSEPQVVKDFLDKYSPSRLVFELFDPRRFGELRPAPIPATADWGPHDTLKITLNQGRWATQLKRGQEVLWSRQIRRFSRTFDMSLATLWRQKLQRAAAHLKEELKQEVMPYFRKILENLPYGPAWAQRVLEEFNRFFEEKRNAMSCSEGDLEEALTALDAAVARRPNPLALSARMTLWLLPALVAAAAILHALYPDARAVLFTTGIVTTGALSAAAAVLLRIYQAHRKVIEARDRALRIVLGRQEALLSQNAIGYLADVVGFLRQALTQAHDCLQRHREQLETAAVALDQKINQDLPDSSVLAPVLARPKQYERLADALPFSEGRWLKAAADAGLFQGLCEPGLDSTKVVARFSQWCEQRLLDPAMARRPDFETLWRVRQEVRDERPLAPILETLRWRAAPLADALKAHPETTVVFAPQELANLLENIQDGQGEIHFIPELPLLCCLRYARLDVPGELHP